MNMLKTAAIATAFAASLIPLSAMAVNQPLICMGQRIDVGATYAELVQRQHQRHSKRQRAHHQDREDQVRSRQQSEPGRNRCRV